MTIFLFWFLVWILNAHPPYMPFQPALWLSLCLSLLACNASWVELWSKHQDKQKAMEKPQSKRLCTHQIKQTRDVRIKDLGCSLRKCLSAWIIEVLSKNNKTSQEWLLSILSVELMVIMDTFSENNKNLFLDYFFLEPIFFFFSFILSPPDPSDSFSYTAACAGVTWAVLVFKTADSYQWSFISHTKIFYMLVRTWSDSQSVNQVRFRFCVTAPCSAGGS